MELEELGEIVRLSHSYLYSKLCHHYDKKLLFFQNQNLNLISSKKKDSLSFHNKFYAFKYKDSIKNVPFALENYHTMGSVLTKYVLQKIPYNLIKYYLDNNLPIEIYGIFPNHFKIYAKKILKENDIKEVKFHYFSSVKKFNFIRPKFFELNNKLAIAVNPGKDYIYHYASFIKYLISLFKINKHKVNIYRFPFAELVIGDLTGINSFIKKNDRVLIGYVNEIKERIDKDTNIYKIKLIETNNNQFYTSYRYLLPNKSVLNLLGVKFSFWGDISAKLASEICQKEVKEIIYIGKLGCLTKIKDIYSKIFSPSRFLIVKENEVLSIVSNLKNNFLNFYPYLNSGSHISVPTVIEETIIQREIAQKFYVKSIDNEISQIAHMVYLFNLNRRNKISFSAIHMATDYLKNKDDHFDFVKLNLTNNRIKEAIKKKNKMLDKIYQLFLNYVLSTN